MRTAFAVQALLALAVMGADSELRILERYGDRAFRPDPAKLCIITPDGDTVVFQNNSGIKFPEQYADWTLVDYLPAQDCWVVEMAGYEWMEWQLVSGSTGESHRAVSRPLPSPGGSRLLCHKEDITACFIENGIQVWRVDPGGLVLEFEDVEVPWGPIDAYWEDDSTIVFQKMTYDYDTWEMLTRPGRLALSSDGRWMPDDPADWEW